jgi:hypothetical protein
MFHKNLAKVVLITAALAAFGCSRSPFEKGTVAPASLRDIPALKLNFRFEPDVPAPAAAAAQTVAEEKNAGVQADFDANRPQEILEKTFTSPDKQRILAVYKRAEDLFSDYRLDIYGADGKLLRQVTPNGMAVRFADTIVWSPDSNNIAFVAVTRTAGAPTSLVPENAAPTPPPVVDANANVDANAPVDANANVNAAPATTTAPDQPKAVLTFRTEQIYICNREGVDVKPLTQTEGLIYFYFVWSPDSSALVGLAATWREWQVGQAQAEQRGEVFIPAGRPRVVERTGRERRLDDNVTTVQPVWSPDSAKVALAFDKEIRIYDAIGDTPTQAAIPLRNPLLISSKAYDDQKRRETEGGGDQNTNTNANTNTNTNTNANANVQPTPAQAANTDTSTLPDENSLVSFNPVIELEWTEDKMLYLRTGYVREMKNAADSAHSYLRWHRLIFSPQPTVIN